MKNLSVFLILGLLLISLATSCTQNKIAEENKTLISQYLAALSGKDKPAETVDKYVADSDSALKQHIALFETAFPQYELIAEDMVAEGDKVAVRALFRGTHTGEFMGILPTDKQVSVALMLIYRIENGKIVEHWSVMQTVPEKSVNNNTMF
jgi:predicted ester cyclase